jgi:alpha-galactosidase
MRRMAVCLAVVAMLSGRACGAEVLNLSAMDLSLMSSGWGKAQANKAVTEKPLSIGTRQFDTGVGTHAESEFCVKLDGKAQRFSALVGVDSAANNTRASAEFIVYGNDKELWRSGVCKWKEEAKACDVSLDGVKSLTLVVAAGPTGINFAHADWADAKIAYSGAKPQAVAAAAVEEAAILTPPPPTSPKLNNAKVHGARPGNPFIYRIPATGQRPMSFAAENLPSGLTLDDKTGIITGKLAQKGETKTTLIAKNAQGEDRRELRIVAGDLLALTPPMGWNSWYIHYHRVSDKTMRAAADVMVSSGMADLGYAYVNIDDCWMVKVNSTDPEIGGPTRDATGKILCNKRFPDMKSMTDHIHAKGLKAGIYTGPGPRTCAGYEAAYQHEAIDARTFAEWGFDFLKYDWCSYTSVANGTLGKPGTAPQPITLEARKKPYQVMWAEIQKQPRDIILNLCQYGAGNVWEWGGEVGHCWRTTGDLGLEGGKLSAGIYKVGLFNATLDKWAGPGKWNDPDYILIGWVGQASQQGEGKPTSLTPNEQYTHMSMWALMAAPLVFSGDMAKLDPFTLNILCNREVIEVDQDPLGRQAKIIEQTPQALILAKDLEDGSKAVGLFNLGHVPLKMTARWQAIGLSGKHTVRDLWRQKELGEFADAFSAEVPRHGVAMVKVK